jgi:hypothetical protein
LEDTPKLTLNLGLRYDFGSPSYEANNRLANFDSQAALAATNQAQALASLRLASDGSLENRSLVKPDRNNFAPRFGFAYSLMTISSCAAVTAFITICSTASVRKTRSR